MINTITVAGNLTRDAELTYSNGEKSIAILKFGIAVNEKYKDEERVHFFDCTILGRLGEAVSNYMTKGTPVAVTGRLQQRRWETDSGDKRSKIEILVQDLQMFGNRDSGSSSSSGGDSFNDDVPF